MSKNIVVRGAKEHNLKNIDVEIPRDKLVVITGLSGSGKSSLAFDTIYAEGQRRYVESLSAYARQFLEQNQKPDVESIEGLSPAISIEQKSTSRNPRSTVGTLTEIYDYLRLLYARAGIPYCYQCNNPIESQTVQEIVDNILSWPIGTKFMVLAPIVRGRKGEYKKELLALQKEGFARVRIDGAMFELPEQPTLDKQQKHQIDVVIDRLVLKADLKQRLTDSVELALRKAEGLVTVAVLGGDEKIFSERFACKTCNVSYPEVEPRLFSFNSPFGACPSCDGLGYSTEIDESKVVPDEEKSLEQGVIAPWQTRWSGFYLAQLVAVAKHYKQSTKKPWSELPTTFRQVILRGSGETSIHFEYEREGSSYKFKKPFEGVIPTLDRVFKESESERSREEVMQYMAYRECQMCHGARLRKEAMFVRLQDKGIHDVCAMTVGDVQKFFASLQLDKKRAAIAVRVLREIAERLQFLESVGLEYLTLDRTSSTLSGGEGQRIRLATQIGSALQGVVYVLDEPSIGLHQRDNDRLLATLKRLRDLGNTVLVVEHDEDTIRAADHVIDMGPGAGIHGGEVVAAGTPERIMANKQSLTGQFLLGKRHIAVPKTRRLGTGETLRLLGASGNNLKNLNVDFPLGKFICVTGVSGSGKSTLINDTLHLALAQAINKNQQEPAPFKKLEGLKHIDKVIDIDQNPIGRTPRSNPATYTQLFGPIRDLFAALPESRARGYTPGRYSFNVKGGRCEACEGDGIIRIEMNFLPDVYVTCEQCHGHRYNRETLEILFKGKSIADVLEMTVEEAAEFLSAIPPIKRKLDTLMSVGLSYVKLGQSATTLSGGEAQRIKLAKELSKRPTGRTLYILDEPTTGLHFADVERLIEVLQALVDAKNTVVVIEHNLDVIKTADHLIDLGPEGGARGGQILGVGTPEEIAANKASYTGAYLRKYLPSYQPTLRKVGSKANADPHHASGSY
jgi:excinuclease ABC subunit A